MLPYKFFLGLNRKNFVQRELQVILTWKLFPSHVLLILNRIRLSFARVQIFGNDNFECKPLRFVSIFVTIFFPKKKSRRVAKRKI